MILTHHSDQELTKLVQGAKIRKIGRANQGHVWANRHLGDTLVEIELEFPSNTASHGEVKRLRIEADLASGMSFEGLEVELR